MSNLPTVTGSWDEARRTYAEAGEWFVGTAARVADRWSWPGLGEWDLRALVGHTSRSFVTIETYLARPAAAVEIGSPAEYYRATRALARGEEVAARSRNAGAARVTALIDGCDGTELVTTIAGGMRLADYLPTRIFELAVHTCDLAAALHLPLDVPPSAASLTLRLITELAVGDGLAGPLLLATTGRRGLPSRFSVL